MELITKRLILRPWKDTDAKDLYEYAKDPEVGPIAGWPVHTCVENSCQIIKDVLSVDETYAVCLKEDNIAIGSIGLISPMQSHTQVCSDEIEIGYWIGKPFWGQGLIPEAIKRLQEHAFIDLKYKVIWCGYYDGNVKSKRCQEKSGFIYHHTEKDKPCINMGDFRTEHFTKLTKEQWEKNIEQDKSNVVLYIHGKGGNAIEAEHYRILFPEFDIVGLDYKSTTPWETKKEITEQANKLKEKYNHIILIANSIGAFFAMNALTNYKIHKAYFISPIVNMEKLIGDMMLWANVTEKELAKKQTIETEFGETLSWDYLCYVREHPIQWNISTDILYGELDNLTSREVIESFSNKPNIRLTIMEGGEHWFHTDKQMEFLNSWIIENETLG